MVSPEILGLDLINYLSAHLTISDLGSLRLSSRALASQVSSSQYYVRHLKTRTVRFTVADLKNFSEATQEDGLCCWLEHLTLSCAAEMRPIGTKELARMRRLLILAFDNIYTRSKKNSIASLCLNVTPGRSSVLFRFDRRERSFRRPHERGYHGTWRCVWDAAARLFTATVSALDTSKLRVLETLDLFTTSPGALGYDMFTSLPREFPSLGSFKDLLYFTGRFSAPMEARPRYKTHENDVGREETCRRVWPGHVLSDISTVLTRMMPNLVNLSVSWYDISRRLVYWNQNWDSQMSTPGTNTIAQPSPAKKMSHCHLAGFFVSESDLLTFLVAHSPRTISAHHVFLTSGRWASILRYLHSRSSSTKWYHLEDVKENLFLVLFQVPGRPKFRLMPGLSGVTELVGEKPLGQEPAEYQLPMPMAPHSREHRAWHQAIRRRFGPLDDDTHYIKLKTPPISPKATTDDDIEEMYLSDDYPDWDGTGGGS
ncbi:hypothetical protein NLG97_g8455 [Lecanicillium saksenae]|uniref:Uncharacterized protein n=1 Tax=Lecanicillium saksenae TaxID=468837 RepID=A0ACC1QIU3_9HYPO|nr:hypothetical protein NLG97_g8455 [Lecanicillium saksenae]